MPQSLPSHNFLSHLSISQKLGLVLGPALFAVIRLSFHPEGLSPEANGILATTLWVAVWWVLEVIPIAATALLPILLFPMTEGLSIKATTASYGHPYVFLFLGGFLLAIAIEKWDLHRRIALNIIAAIGSKVDLIILGFMLASAFLSMW
ncbi:MAG: SLC13 family permease, partial [Bacteroidota bacterium]